MLILRRRAGAWDANAERAGVRHIIHHDSGQRKSGAGDAYAPIRDEVMNLLTSVGAAWAVPQMKGLTNNSRELGL